MEGGCDPGSGISCGSGMADRAGDGSEGQKKKKESVNLSRVLDKIMPTHLVG